MKLVSRRLAELRIAMTQHGCDVFIMPSSDPHSSEYAPAHYTAWEYFSGFSCENANLVVTTSEAALWVDGRFFGAADAALKDSGVASMHMGVKGVPTVNAWIEERLRPGMVLGYCAETMPLTQMRSLKAVCEKVGAEMRDLPLVDEAWTDDRPALPTSPAWILDAAFAGLVPGQKMEIVREKLRGLGCTAMLVTKLDCVAWLFNLRAGDVYNTPYALAFAYLSQNRAILFMDASRLNEKAKQILASNGVELQGYTDMPAFLSMSRTPETVLADPSTLNSALYNALAANPVFSIVEAQDPIVMLKAVKNDVELHCSRRAHIRDAVAMVRFQMELEFHMDKSQRLMETDIQKMLFKYRSAGENFIEESFPTIAAFGRNAAMMHYAPREGSDAALRKSGFLLVDSGATYYDGTTDITRTYPMGRMTEDEMLAYTRVLRCHIDMAMAVWKEGATGGELDMLARQPLWHHMLDYRCGTGHSVSHVGAVHEGPHSLRPHNNVVFVPGMVITDEPGIYEEGSLGIRIENELICVEAGESEYGRFLMFEPLMYVPIATSCVIKELLSVEEKEWLNWYHGEVVRKLSPYLNGQEIDWLKNKCAAI